MSAEDLAAIFTVSSLKVLVNLLQYLHNSTLSDIPNFFFSRQMVISAIRTFTHQKISLKNVGFVRVTVTWTLSGRGKPGPQKEAFQGP